MAWTATLIATHNKEQHVYLMLGRQAVLENTIQYTAVHVSCQVCCTPVLRRAGDAWTATLHVTHNKEQYVYLVLSLKQDFVYMESLTSMCAPHIPYQTELY